MDNIYIFNDITGFVCKATLKVNIIFSSDMVKRLKLSYMSLDISVTRQFQLMASPTSYSYKYYYLLLFYNEVLAQGIHRFVDVINIMKFLFLFAFNSIRRQTKVLLCFVIRKFLNIENVTYRYLIV